MLTTQKDRELKLTRLQSLRSQQSNGFCFELVAKAELKN
jgi:hypothetical protein